MNNLGSKNDTAARYKIKRVRKLVKNIIYKADRAAIINNGKTN